MGWLVGVGILYEGDAMGNGAWMAEDGSRALMVGLSLG